MTFGNSKLIQCLCTINDYIIEEGIDLSTYADTLEKKKSQELYKWLLRLFSPDISQLLPHV